MRITLVRHGRPVLAFPRVSGHRLRDWMDAYNLACVDPTLIPSVHLRKLASESGSIIASDLPRAIESSRMLAPGRPITFDPLFREADLPTLPRTFFRFHPHVWAVVARTGWFLGYSRGTESLLEARRRARTAVDKLAALALENGSVTLIGHGVFNALIAGELRSHGWRGPLRPTVGYWSAVSYGQ